MEVTDFSGSLPPPPPPPPQPNLPPGFRFHPTDEELVVHYLKRKADSVPLPVAIIADVDLYKFDPWELPAKASFGEQEWYFFSPRDRKYPNGARPNRAATSGYWKATGTDKPVISGGGGGGGGGKKKIGVKKALVFYGGKPPKGVKSDWIMHEYRLTDHNNKHSHLYDFTTKKNSLRLDDWVLCRIYKKNNNTTTSRHHHHNHYNDDHYDMMMISDDHIPQAISRTNFFPAIFSDNNDPAAMYDGGGSYSTNHILASSSGSKAEQLFPPMMMMMASVNQDPSIGSSPSSKRFNGGVGDCSMAATPLIQQQGGVLGEGLIRTSYQLSGLNWYG